MTMGLARELKRDGHHVVLFAQKGSHSAEFELVEMPEDWRPWFARKKSDYRLDFVHFQEPYHEDPRIPYLVTIYGNAQPGEVFLPNSNFVSRSQARNHASSLFVYNGVQVEEFQFSAQREDYYVFMAKNRRVKNVKTAIAWAEDLGLRLKIIGFEGRSRKGIEFLGPLGETDGKLEVLAKARSMVCPYNWNEPFALTPLEALASGCSLISSANGSLPEATPAEVGVICHNYQEMLDAPKRTAQISPVLCREFVATQFSMQRSYQGYKALYDRVLRQGVLGPAPFYNFQPNDIHWLFKPTWYNKLRLRITGKI
jgi:glycosyltransferase involved in cell wall biosynthesis